MEKKAKTRSNTNLTVVDKKIYPVYNPLTNKIKRNSIANIDLLFSGYKSNKNIKTIAPQNVIGILAKSKKLRLDIENRMVADYLSVKYKYFQKIRDQYKIGYLKLIPALKYQKVEEDEIIINIGDENNNLYLILEGSVIVYKESKYKANRLLIEIRNYLRKLHEKDKEKFEYIIKKNKNLDLNFDEIIKDDFKSLILNKKFDFYYEELEEMGTYSEGFTFGETELINKTNRDLVIKSVTNCKLIYVNKFDYNRILKTTEEKALEKKADIFIKNFPLFKEWTIEQLIKLFNYLVQENYNKYEYIYKQNDENEYLYFLEEGAIIQYANISFSWYKEYIEYIENFNDNLLDDLLKIKYGKHPLIIEPIDDINEYLNDKIELIKKENKSKKNKIKYPFLKIQKIHLEKKKDLIQMSELYKKENSIDNFFKIKFEENDLNNPEHLYRIPISSTKIPAIFGLEESFEFKNKLTTVACVTDQVNLKKIKIVDLLNILYSYKEYDYMETFMEIVIQKKLILSKSITNQIKKNGAKLEINMLDRYEKIITQPKIIINKEQNSFIVDEKLQDEAIVSLRLKGWNNGLYLDNILDTNLDLIKPKSRKYIKKEEAKKCKTLNYLCNIKTITNEKKLYSTKLSLDKFYSETPSQFFRSFKINNKKHKHIIGLKSISIINQKLKNKKHIKFFKTNIPLDNDRAFLEKMEKKIEKENKNENTIISKKSNTISSSPIKIIKNKKHVFKKLINYKVSEESKFENKNDNGYLNKNSGSIWTKSNDFLPSILGK